MAPHRAAWVAVALSLLAGGAFADARAGVDVAGKVVLSIDHMSVADLGPVVVYLEPVGGAASRPAAGAPLEMRQRNAAFSPGFLAVAAGDPVRMPNDDQIFHNVFSYSKGNQFDLGLYPAGESRTVEFATPGVVKMYCSIHESMNATVFVSPSPFFAMVSATGAFRMRDVPPGRYRVRTWCERLPDSDQELRVGPDGARGVEIRLGGDLGG